jgi:Raf kinase inhibitor-like YbhB/YbcL family protein
MKAARVAVILFFAGANLVGHAQPYSLVSPELQDGGALQLRHSYNAEGCSGQNYAPALRWSGEPQGTRSFALTLFDPDARRGGGWWHWLVWNIPATEHALTPGTVPPGSVQGRNDFGQAAYGGPCPPAGDPPHHYVFTLYALPAEAAALPADASPAQVKGYLNGHALAQARLTGRFGR